MKIHSIYTVEMDTPSCSSSSSSTTMSTLPLQARGISSFFKPVSSMFLDEDLSHPSIVQAQSARTQVQSPTNLRNQIELAQRCASDLARNEIYDEAAEVETQATRLIHELRMISEEFELVRASDCMLRTKLSVRLLVLVLCAS